MEALHPLVYPVDLLDLPRQALFIKPPGHGDPFGVVRYRQVLVAPLLRSLRHLLDGELSIRVPGVALKVPLDVFQGHQPGKPALGRGL